MEFKQWLSEMPIGKAKLIGQWDKFPAGRKQHQHWDKGSYNILTNDENLAKLRNRWRRVPQTFDMYFLKKPGMRNYIEIGEVDLGAINDLGIDVPKINRENITIFFTNNRGAERVPMTPWTIGHRFGHAVRRINSYNQFNNHVNNDFAQLLKQIYNKNKPSQYSSSISDGGDHEAFMRQIMQAFGSMRSAREKVLFREGEFTHELFGQYILTGKITFREEIPRQLVTRYAWGNPTWDGSAYSQVHGKDKEYELEEIIQTLRSNAAFYNSQCNRVLNDCIGKIFVM